ncbi:zinc finger MYM-type protein 1-like, partial [Aphis craccivora]
MRGEYAGLQALVCAENPAATYTWFYAHRLSLIVVQGSSIAKKEFLGLIMPKKKHYPKQRVHRLKRVEITRWFSLSSALNTAIVTFNAMIDTSIKIQRDEGCADFKSGAKATGTIKSLHLVTDKIKELRTDNAYTELCKKSEIYIEKSDMEFSPLPIH